MMLSQLKLKPDCLVQRRRAHETQQILFRRAVANGVDSEISRASACVRVRRLRRWFDPEVLRVEHQIRQRVVIERRDECRESFLEYTFEPAERRN